MSATIGELLHIIQEAIRAEDPANVFVIGPQLQDAIWKIESGRQKDVKLAGVLRWEKLIKQVNNGRTNTTRGGARSPDHGEPAA